MRRALALVLGAATWLAGGAAWGEPLEREAFCRDEDYPLSQWEHDWCPLVGDPNASCPSLPEACKGEPRQARSGEGKGGRVRYSETECSGEGCEQGGGARQRGAHGDGSGSGSGEGPPGDGNSNDGDRGDGQSGDGNGSAGGGKTPGGGKPPPPEPEPPPSLEVPAGMSTAAQIAFFVVLALALAWLIWTIVKNRMAGKLDAVAQEKEGEAAPDAAAPAARQAVERDVLALLERARRAAAGGDYKQAIDDAYAAALRRLEGDGLIDMHSSLTNGDYVRAIGSRPQLAQALGQIVRDVDSVHFGSVQPSAPLFEGVLARVMPLVQRALLVLLFLAAPWLGGCGPRLAGDQAGLEDRPSGTTAVVRALRQRGVEAGHRIAPLAEVGDDVGALVVLTAAVDGELDWDPVLAWVDSGGLLFLAGVRPEHPRVPLGLRPNDAAGNALAPEWYYVSKLAGLELAVPPGPALGKPYGAVSWRDVLSRDDDSTYAAAGRLGAGEIVAFADDRLFSNIAMAVADNAEGVARILEGHGKVELCTALTGAAAATPLDSLNRAHLTPLVAQLLLLLLLFVLWRGTAFGTRRDPPEHRRRNFADHVRALGLQYARASASSHALGIYARWTLERLRERLPRGRRSDQGELIAEIAHMSGRAPAQVEAILSRAQGASDAYGPASMRPSSLRPNGMHLGAGGDAAADVELMRQLTQLMSDVGRAQDPSRKRDPG
jgi:hypothetical protein